MRLHFAGQQLSDSESLKHSRICTGSSVQLVVVTKTAARKARVFLRCAEELRAFDVHLETLVKDVCREAQALFDAKDMVLSFRGRRLDEEKCLKEAGVEMGNVMKLAPRTPSA